MSETKIEVAGGKYAIILRDGAASSRLRYGDDKGPVSNTEYWLACEVRDLRAEIVNLKQRREDLLSANNRYLDRARLAERALRLFREFVTRNVTQWALGAGHHHPIWKWVAGILAATSQNETVCWGYEYQFVHAENKRDLADLEEEET